MVDQPAVPEPGSNPRLPWVLFALSTTVALLAATGFVYLIAQRTTGPGEVLRDYYQAVHDDDCARAYGMLAPTHQRFPLEPEWCAEVFPTLDLTATFDVRSITLETQEDLGGEVEFARVEVVDANSKRRVWTLVRSGESWLMGGQGIPVGRS